MLITIYKAFIRYSQAFNTSFKEKLESIQNNASIPLTGAISGMSKEKKSIKNCIGVPSRSTLV